MGRAWPAPAFKLAEQAAGLASFLCGAGRLYPRLEFSRWHCYRANDFPYTIAAIRTL